MAFAIGFAAAVGNRAADNEFGYEIFDVGLLLNQDEVDKLPIFLYIQPQNYTLGRIFPI